MTTSNARARARRLRTRAAYFPPVYVRAREIVKPPCSMQEIAYRLGLKPKAFRKLKTKTTQHRIKWLPLRSTLGSYWTDYLAMTFVEKTNDTIFGGDSDLLMARGHAMLDGLNRAEKIGTLQLDMAKFFSYLDFIDLKYQKIRYNRTKKSSGDDAPSGSEDAPNAKKEPRKQKPDQKQPPTASSKQSTAPYWPTEIHKPSRVARIHISISPLSLIRLTTCPTSTLLFDTIARSLATSDANGQLEKFDIEVTIGETIIKLRQGIWRREQDDWAEFMEQVKELGEAEGDDGMGSIIVPATLVKPEH